jgi:small-conductance mechanosensitive channel
MLQAIIEPLSDFATWLAQASVGYIADHANLKRDGVTFFLLKILISVFVYLTIVIAVPIAILMLLFKFVLPIFF